MTTVDADSTREHWDAQAATYDRAKARNALYYETLKALVAGSVPPSCRRVLDAGCGTGQVLAGLQVAHGTGIDLSEQMIAQARRRYADRPELVFTVADAAEGAPPPGTFDAVICTDVLEHAEDWRAALDALAAACRGTIVVTTPNPWWALPLWALEKLRLKMPEGPHRYVPGRAVAARLRELGFSVQRRDTHLLVPARLGGMGPRISRVCARLPVLRRLGVIQLVVAAREGLPS